MAEVVRVYKESFPEIRFIGKRYGDADRGADGGFGWKWDEWFQKGYFEPLMALPKESINGDAYIGFMRFTHELEYWIGMFFPAGTPVPEGFASIDLPAGDVGICWIYGRDDTGELYGPQAHEMCVAKLEESGWSIQMPCFERYVDERFIQPDEKGNVIVDYGIYLKP